MARAIYEQLAIKDATIECWIISFLNKTASIVNSNTVEHVERKSNKHIHNQSGLWPSWRPWWYLITPRRLDPLPMYLLPFFPSITSRIHATSKVWTPHVTLLIWTKIMSIGTWRETYADYMTYCRHGRGHPWGFLEDFKNSAIDLVWEMF